MFQNLNNKNSKHTFLILSIIGFLIPNWVVIDIIMKTGTIDFVKFIATYDSSLYQRFISFDFLITATTFMAIYFFEYKNLDKRYRFFPLIGAFAVGVCFGFPLLMYLLVSKNNQ
jgi:hypothetical protein